MEQSIDELIVMQDESDITSINEMHTVLNLFLQVVLTLSFLQIASLYVTGVMI